MYHDPDGGGWRVGRRQPGQYPLFVFSFAGRTSPLLKLAIEPFVAIFFLLAGEFHGGGRENLLFPGAHLARRANLVAGSRPSEQRPRTLSGHCVSVGGFSRPEMTFRFGLDLRRYFSRRGSRRRAAQQAYMDPAC